MTVCHWCVRVIGTLCLVASDGAQALSEVHVDFQPAGGAAAAGYVAVTNNNRWDNGTSVDLGGGVRGAWLDYMTVHTGDRGASYPDLTRDFIQWYSSDTPETFKMTGLLAGTYDLKIYSWDHQYNDKVTEFEIDVNDDGTFDLSMQISNRAGEHDKTTSVTVSSDGVLSIKVSRPTGDAAAICGLDLTSGAPDTTPPAVITTLAVAGQTTTQVMLRWTAPADDSGAGGKVASYDVRHSTSSINEGNWASAAQASGEPTPANPGTQENFTVNGLAPSTTYYFAVKSADAASPPNVSPLSNVVSATTDAPDVTPPAAVTDLAASSVQSNQLTLTWTASGDDGAAGTASTYNLRYSVNPITDDASFNPATAATGVPAPKVAGSAESFTVTGLAADTTYYFSIKVADEVPNWSGLSNIIQPVTLSPGTTVAVDYSDGHRHQTMISWDASAPNVYLPEFQRNQAVDVLVNDLGLIRLRLQAPDRRAWEDRYNDNGDPFTIDWSRFDAGPTDTKMEEWILPFKAAVEARGEPFGCYASTSFYNNSVTGAIPVWMLRNPGEYTEWAQAQMYHLKTRYNFVLDYWSICNEPGNNNDFTATLMGRIARVLGPRMQAMGLPTKIQFSESVSSNATWNYVQSLQADAEFWKYVGMLTYHLYGEHWSSPSPDMRANVYAFAQARNIPTGQTEFMDADTDDIYEDLTIGGVSAWEQFQACALGKGDVAGSGSYMTARYDGCSFIRGPAFWDFRQFMHYIRPGAVRVDATSTDTSLKAVAFLKDGRITVVLLNNYTGSTTQAIRVTGLPAGQYGLCQTVNRAVYAELGIQTVGVDGALETSVTQGAVMTLYPYAGTNMAPIFNDWNSSSHFLTQPASTTTLSVLAVDPELDPLTCAWTIVSQPAGANAVLATPSAATCAVSGMTVAGDYLFNIAVSDAGRTTSKHVKVPVLAGNQPPVIGSAGNKGPVSVILPTTTTTLSGGGYDLEGDTLSYLWTLISQPAGASAVLATPTSGNCNVSGLTVPGTYVFRFQLGDPTHAVTADASVVVDPANAHAPSITSATGQVLPDGRGRLSAVTSDADGDVISHWWMLEIAPANATVTFYDQGQPVTDLWADVAGTYKFRLVVVDRTLYTESSQITLNLPATSRHAGDINADGVVDVSDLLRLAGSWAKSWGEAGYDWHCDLGGDGRVDVSDVLGLAADWPGS